MLFSKLARSGPTARALSSSMAWKRHSSSVSTISDALNSAVDEYKYKEAVRFFKDEYLWSYTELHQFVHTQACAFIDMEIQKGDFIATFLPNSPENLVVHLAAAKAGVAVASIDPKLADGAQLDSILKDSGAKMLIYDPKLQDRNITEFIQNLYPQIKMSGWEPAPLRVKHLPMLKHVVTTGTYDIEGVHQICHLQVNGMDDYEVSKRTKQVDADTVFSVSYTVGPDGNVVKGKAITQGEFLAQAQSMVDSLKLSPNDKILMEEGTVGLSPAVVASFLKTSQVIVPSPEADEAASEKAMNIEGCSIKGRGIDAYQRL